MKFLYVVLAALFSFASAFVPSAFRSARQSRLVVEMKDAGKVKFFDSTKGFGFITPDAGGEDIFVHQSAIHANGFRSLADGEEVEFEVQEDPRRGKKFAVNVTGPNGAFVQGAPRREAKPFNSRF